MQISRGARLAVDKLNKRYSRCEIAGSFASLALDALVELERAEIPGACMHSVIRIIDTLVANRSEVLECNHGGQYLLHVWRRSEALDQLLGGALGVEDRYALIELATLVCIEQGWTGYPIHPFAPLQPPWWAILNAIVETKTIQDSRARLWQAIVAHLRKRPVDGAPQSLACALAWCGVVDVERDELFDEDFAEAACKERRWFNVNRGFGLRLLGQFLLVWDGIAALQGGQS